MNKLSVFMLITLLSLSVFKIDAQGIQKGNHLIDIYYGPLPFPRVSLRVFTTSFENQKYSGPIGLRYEYMVSNRIGIGVEANIQEVSESWTENGFTYNLSKNAIRIMPKFNFHFVQSKTFDGYLGVASGLTYNRWSASSTDQNYNSNTNPNRMQTTMRVGLGGRYFLTENFGINLEFGVGAGSLVHGGVSYKL